MAVTTWTAGQVLAAADLNDTFASKLNLAGGKILQIVRAGDSTNRSTTSTSFVDVTGMSVTITPQKSDSAILIMAHFIAHSAAASGTNLRTQWAITDSSNNVIGASSITFGGDGFTAAGASNLYTPTVLVAYATPATTSAVSYKLRFARSADGTNVTAISRNAEYNSFIYAIEVSA